MATMLSSLTHLVFVFAFWRKGVNLKVILMIRHDTLVRAKASFSKFLHCLNLFPCFTLSV